MLEIIGREACRSPYILQTGRTGACREDPDWLWGLSASQIWLRGSGVGFPIARWPGSLVLATVTSVSSQLRVQPHHIGSLRLAVAGLFTLGTRTNGIQIQVPPTPWCYPCTSIPLMVILNNHELERREHAEGWEVDGKVLKEQKRKKIILKGDEEAQIFNAERGSGGWFLCSFLESWSSGMPFHKHRCNHFLRKMGCFHTFKKGGSPLLQQLLWGTHSTGIVNACGAGRVLRSLCLLVLFRFLAHGRQSVWWMNETMNVSLSQYCSYCVLTTSNLAYLFVSPVVWTPGRARNFVSLCILAPTAVLIELMNLVGFSF